MLAISDQLTRAEQAMVHQLFWRKAAAGIIQSQDSLVCCTLRVRHTWHAVL